MLALFSDIHSNLQAFSACLDDASERGASDFVLLGDYVGYGGDPIAVMTLVQGLCKTGAIAVKGNHDDMAADFDRLMNPSAARAANWTRAQLSEDDRQFLADLPYELKRDDCHFVHADVSAPQKWHYVTDSDAARDSLLASDKRVVFCGHVHQPAVYSLSAEGPITRFVPDEECVIPLLKSRRWHIVIPSVGQPRDGNPLTGYALYNPATTQLTFVRLPYDIEGASRAISEAGLPIGLANRLHKGR